LANQHSQQFYSHIVSIYGKTNNLGQLSLTLPTEPGEIQIKAVSGNMTASFLSSSVKVSNFRVASSQNGQYFSCGSWQSVFWLSTFSEACKTGFNFHR
jgi:hypothetical protein